PCGQPHVPPPWSTREPFPSDVRPCRPCLRSLAACFGPLTQIRDPLLPPCPPPPRRSHVPGLCSPVERRKILGLQRTYHAFSRNSQQYKHLGKGFPASPDPVPLDAESRSALEPNGDASAVWVAENRRND